MPTPREDETREEFVSRCIPIVLDEGTADDQDQAAAVCNSMWEDAKEEKLVSFGGNVKALGEGHLTGTLVKFSSPDEPDLEMDYFDRETDFDIEDGAKTAIYFNHRKPLRTPEGKSVAVRDKIGEGGLKFSDGGLLVDAIVYNRELYDEVIAPMAEAGKLGWSSGTASHLIDREAEGKAYHIKRWPLGLDASITPIPAEPQTQVIPIKQLKSAVTGIVPDEPGEQSGEGAEDKGTSEVPSEGVARKRAEALNFAINVALEG